jgi:hypothetical protein
MTVLQHSVDRVFAMLCASVPAGFVGQQEDCIAPDFIIGHEAITTGSPMLKTLKITASVIAIDRYLRKLFNVKV